MKYLKYLKYLFIAAEIVQAVESARAGDTVPLHIRGIRVGKQTFELTGELAPEAE